MGNRCVLMLLLLVSVSSIGIAQDNQPKSTRPNIVLIMADDLGWMDLNCQGNETLDTPAINKLASQGMRFTNGYAASPVCTPTRAAMMTGISPARLGITNHAPGNQDYVSKETNLRGADWTTYLSLDHVTIAERLKSAGYKTGFVGKWHLSHRKGENETGKHEPQLRPEFQGFDLNVGGCSRGGPPSYFAPYKIPAIAPGPPGEYLPERLADESIQFIQENVGSPFFLCLWNYSVHYPIQAPDDLIEKYKKREGVENAGYAAMIEGMDTAIGRVLKSLDDLGAADNTLVIFTSDNGSLFGNKPLRRNKGYLYEGGIRVPWIVRWPGVVKPGTTCETPIISTDIVPTLLAATQQNPNMSQFDGVSLMPLLNQTGQLSRDALYFHYPNYAFHKRNRLGSAIRRGQYKLIQWHDDQSVELYNLASEIGETTNLASKHPQLASDLQKQLTLWLKDANAKLPTLAK